MGRVLRRIAAVICLGAAVILILAAGLPERAAYLSPRTLSPNQTLIAPEIGAIAPPLNAFTAKGEPFDLAAYRGSTLILNFWASWCAPCVQEMPALERLYSQGVSVVGINVGDAPGTILAWAEEYGITFPLVVDQTGRLSRLYRLLGLPATFQIDKAGVVRQVKFGALSDAELDAWTRPARLP